MRGHGPGTPRSDGLLSENTMLLSHQPVGQGVTGRRRVT